MNGRLLAYILAAVLAPALALAAPITSLVVVGDSLSDDGNGFILTGGTFPPPPYDQGGSNGPVAVEYLASALGLPLAPSAAGGTNYAVLGAATGAVVRERRGTTELADAETISYVLREVKREVAGDKAARASNDNQVVLLEGRIFFNQSLLFLHKSYF